MATRTPANDNTPDNSVSGGTVVIQSSLVRAGKLVLELGYIAEEIPELQERLKLRIAVAQLSTLVNRLLQAEAKRAKKATVNR